MTHPNRRRGDTYERALVAFFRANGCPGVERAYGGGRPDDVGDLSGLPGFCVSAKDCAQWRGPQWMDELEAQRERSGATYGVLVAKRRNKPVGDSYVVMTLAAFAELVKT